MIHPSSTGSATLVPVEQTWFRGIAGSGMVALQIDDSATDVRVALRRGWQSAVVPHQLAAAVLEALRAAVIARSTAWLTDRGAEPAGAPATGAVVRTPAPVSTRESAETLRRAFRDLREYRLQIAALGRTPMTVAGPGREVTVTAVGGQVVDLQLDPRWRVVATDADLERRITDALRTALRRCASIPRQALEGCPDLAAVLADAPGGSPVAVPDADAAGRSGVDRGAHR